jgi:hypothetical protein
MRESTAEEPQVVLTAGDGSEIRLVFSAPQRPWSDEIVDYLVDVGGAGLEARAVVTSLEGDSLADYFADLAEEFKGWSGIRQWRSLEDQLRVEARWGSRGHVTLTFRLRPKAYDVPWDLSIDVDVEAGAEMEALSVAVANFFEAAG